MSQIKCTQAQLAEIVARGVKLDGWKITIIPDKINAGERKQGRPRKDSGQGIIWDDINWDMSNSEIARKLGISRQTVFDRRKKLTKTS